MSHHAKTIAKVETALAILSEYNPMTLRQLFYQLVSRQAIENNQSSYDSLGKAIVDARKEGIIPWEWIEDRTRLPHEVGQWDNLADFAETALAAYRRDIWATQPTYLEVWLEKNALAGVFLPILEEYGVTLNVGIGYDGWTSIRNAADRFEDKDDVTVLYFGDFDPSGEDMVKSLGERLAFFGASPEIIKCALTMDDVERYHLPPNKTKKSDTRSKGFIEKHGDISVELDALPVEVLEARVEKEVADHLDLEALAQVREIEAEEKKQLRAALKEISR